MSDPVNHPHHYTQYQVEVIDIIEDAIKEAPDTVTGYLQGQTLKYLLRMWHKSDSEEDAKKARWYLNRLIDILSGYKIHDESTVHQPHPISGPQVERNPPFTWSCGTDLQDSDGVPFGGAW